jgi:HK97 family phage portal protein
MGILDRLRVTRTVERTVYVTAASVKGMSASQLYESQPALRSVISFLADNVAGLPLKCYVRNVDGGRERDRTSTLAQVLKSPNSWATTHELVRATVSEYLLHDDSLWLVVPDNTPSGWTVAVIPHDWVSPTTNDGLSVTKIKVRTPYGGETELSPDDFIRFCGWSPYGSASSSPRIEALKDILSEQISAWNFRNGVWRNGGRVTQWISRPADTPWGDGAKDRFAKSWKAKFASDEGTDTGGTPLLEDGMRLETTTFNAREAQWVEATRLSREDVCAVYHVNPGLIYHTDATTYASAKDNARALYADTLAPILDMIEERINAFLIPRLGLDESHYCEFDLDAKLQGSFEERAQVMQSSVGAPWMTRNEARAMLNLPAIDGGDELITPLNVVEGGQASPNDVDGVESGYNSAQVSTKSTGVRIKSAPDDDDADEIASTLRKFFKRQARSVKPTGSDSKSDGFPDWWNAERWERELAEDLTPIFQRQAAKRGRSAVRDARLGGEFDADRIEEYIKAMARGKSKAINNVTYRQLREAIDGDMDENAMGATVSGVFEKAETQRADTAAKSFATAVAGFAILEAARQRAGDRRVTKTWIVTSDNPRAEHAAMDGETVAYDDEFSNGARFPGDQTLTPEESCNCKCQVEILIP